MAAPMSLEFTVRRCEPELVAPASFTPRGLKQLSDIDDQDGLRLQMLHIQFYRHNPLMEGRDPVKVIREAVAQTLVFYYPFAGRVREGPDRKLMVDCTGEGVLFIEADADVRLEQFGDPIDFPIPCLEELLYNVPDSDGILDCPLLLIQVTRLKCGGFIFALRFNHTICDGIGLVQLMIAIGEMARGANAASILPSWHREQLNARNPPRVTFTHNEYIDPSDTNGKEIDKSQIDNVAERAFFLGSTELSTMYKLIPSHLHPCTKFELLTACLWRCFTIACQPKPNEEVKMLVPVNARHKYKPPLPRGFYGNAIAMPVALTTAGKLCSNSLGHALELIRSCKKIVTEEYMKSIADLMVTKGRPPLAQTYYVSDLTHLGFEKMDFGWGKPLFMGPPRAGWEVDGIPAVASFYLPSKNKKGEDGILMIVSLPASAMERFVMALKEMLKDEPKQP